MGVGVSILQKLIGKFSDFVGVPYDSSSQQSLMSYLRTGYYHVHGTSFVYPSLADNVALTAEAADWGIGGAITEVIPAGVLNVSAFDLHWLNIHELSGNADYEVQVFSGGVGEEVQIGAARTNRNANFTREGAQPIQIPQQVTGARISCRLCTSGTSADTCTVSFSGHYYAG